MNLMGIYGASGCGRGIMPLLRASQESKKPVAKLVFIDDGLAGTTANGHEVWAWNQFLNEPCEERHVGVAIADPETRERLARKCLEAGVGILSVRADNVVLMDEVEVGEGALLSPFVTLTSNIRIGRFFHANLYSYVEHDCIIGDFVTFAPGVHCNGNVVIEDHAYIGAGAIIKQGKPGSPLVIGRGAVVGMGAVVTRSVPPGATVVGNPARPIKQG